MVGLPPGLVDVSHSLPAFRHFLFLFIFLSLSHLPPSSLYLLLGSLGSLGSLGFLYGIFAETCSTVLQLWSPSRTITVNVIFPTFDHFPPSAPLLCSSLPQSADQYPKTTVITEF
jgi:hypothetical protein